MATNNARKTILSGIIVLLLAGGASLYFLRHKIFHAVEIVKGKSIVARHLAEPDDLTSRNLAPATSWDGIKSFPAWKSAPRGFQTFAGVPLQIDGMMCLWGEANEKMGLHFPEKVEGIVMNQKFETLYVYHGAFFVAPDLTPVYYVIFHYEDESAFTNQIDYGTDVLDWYANRGKEVIGPTGARSKLAWTGGAPQPIRFCLTALANPHPELKITTIDLVSCKNRSAACVMAMTPGKSGLMR